MISQKSQAVSGLGKGKAAMLASRRSPLSNWSLKETFSISLLYSVGSSDGKTRAPVLILPGVLHEYWKHPDETEGTLLNYLPAKKCLAHRSSAIMTNDIFFLCVELFIAEKQRLERSPSTSS